MRTKIPKLLTFISVLICLGGYSQDKIILKNGNEINGWIIEKSDKEIKYKIQDASDSPIILTKTNKIDKIIFKDGQIMKVSPDAVRMDKPIGVKVGLMIGLESGNYKIQADYFLNPAINIDVNMIMGGLGGGGLTTGINYYFNPNKPSPLKIYAGLSCGAVWSEFVLGVPFGLSLTSKKGFDLKLGINEIYGAKYGGVILYSELLLGWRF